jgi:hypothetical protein
MKKVFFITILCGSVLAACGGGGGGDNSTANNSPASAQVGPPVALSTENYEPAAREIVGSVSSLQSTGTAAQSFLTGVEVMSSMSSPAMLLQEKLPELAQLLKRGTHLTGAQYTEAIACPAGGKMDVIANDNNNNEELDAGDNVDLTLTSCQYGGLKITGKMGFRINSGTAFSNMTAASINISATINDYKAEFNDTVSIGDGSFTMNIAQAYLAALSGPAVSIDIQTPLMTTQVTQADTTKVFQLKNYTVNAIVSSTFTSWSVNGNVSVPTLGANTADIQTITRFTPAAATNYAAGGALLITVRDGGKMRVTATGTANAKVELDLNSDGIYETFKLVPWIDVL